MFPLLFVSGDILGAGLGVGVFLIVEDIVVDDETARQRNQLTAGLIELVAQVAVGTVEPIGFVDPADGGQGVHPDQAVVHQELMPVGKVDAELVPVGPGMKILVEENASRHGRRKGIQIPHGLSDTVGAKDDIVAGIHGIPAAGTSETEVVQLRPGMSAGAEVFEFVEDLRDAVFIENGPRVVCRTAFDNDDLQRNAAGGRFDAGEHRIQKSAAIFGRDDDADIRRTCLRFRYR